MRVMTASIKPPKRPIAANVSVSERIHDCGFVMAMSLGFGAGIFPWTIAQPTPATASPAARLSHSIARRPQSKPASISVTVRHTPGPERTPTTA